MENVIRLSCPLVSVSLKPVLTMSPLLFFLIFTLVPILCAKPAIPNWPAFNQGFTHNSLEDTPSKVTQEHSEIVQK